MSSIRVKTHINAAAIPGSMPVSLTRLAVWRIAILHLASIVPTVKVLKYESLSASWVLYGMPRGNAPRILCNNLLF